MEALKIQNGKFYRGSEIIQPVIGDAEQIKTLRLYEKQLESLKDAIPVDVMINYVGRIEWDCECGCECEIAIDDELGHPVDSDFVGEHTRCFGCKTEYIADWRNSDLVVRKLIIIK